MAATLAIIISLLIGSPVGAALTLPQIAALAGVIIKGLPAAIKTEKQLYAFVNSPAFAQMLARNGDAAIRWQDRQMEY